MQRLGLLLLIVIIVISCGPAAMAGSAPSAFANYPTSGLTMMPSVFQSGQKTYTLNLASGAYIEAGGVQFPITVVWGFYAVNKTGLAANETTAGGPSIGDWRWDQNPAHGSSLNVAGWVNPSKSQAMLTPVSGSVSKQFTFTNFSFSGVAPAIGYHISISVPQGATSPFGSGVTGSIIPKTVPEPSSCLAILTATMGLSGLVTRRKTRK